MLYPIYRSLTSLSSPVLNRLLSKRLAQGKEDGERLSERRGIATTPRPDGKLMWVHGASVGESLSVLPLLNTLKARLPEWQFMVTTGTITSARIMTERLPQGAFHQFIPLDHPQWAKNFVDHWKPDAVIWLESELWPNLLHEISSRNIPASLINARMRPTTFERWKKAKPLAAKMLGTFRLILVGARDYIRYFKELGGKNVSYVGSMKFGARALPVDANNLAGLKRMIGDRPCIGFLQTHPTEEVIAAETWRELRTKQPGLLAIVAPRNNRRGQEIKEELKAKGYNVALRTTMDIITPGTDIYIADTIGEMGLWYTLCPIAVIGGSFITHGGQNPIEGTHFGTAVLYGPHMFNFPELCAVIEEGGAAIKVANPAELTKAIVDLYDNPDKLAKIKASALDLAEQNHSVIDAFADEIIIQLVKN